MKKPENIDHIFRRIFSGKAKNFQTGEVIEVKFSEPFLPVQEVNKFDDIVDEIIDFYSK